jgi:hypothetical protein
MGPVWVKQDGQLSQYDFNANKKPDGELLGAKLKWKEAFFQGVSGLRFSDISS